MSNWYNAVILRGWYNRGILGEDAAQIAIDEAAAEAARQAARDADTADREYWEHHAAQRAKAYRAAQIAAKASAELAATPAPEPMAPVVVDPIKVAEAVQHLRSLRSKPGPVDPSRAWGGGVFLP